MSGRVWPEAVCSFRTLCKIVEIKIGGKTRFENLLKQLFHSPLLDTAISIRSVSMRKPGRTRQEVIQLKSPISLKPGTNVGFGE